MHWRSVSTKGQNLDIDYSKKAIWLTAVSVPFVAQIMAIVVIAFNLFLIYFRSASF